MHLLVTGEAELVRPQIESHCSELFGGGVCVRAGLDEQTSRDELCPLCCSPLLNNASTTGSERRIARPGCDGQAPRGGERFVDVEMMSQVGTGR